LVLLLLLNGRRGGLLALRRCLNRVGVRAEGVEEAGEGGRGEEHAGEVCEALVLGEKLAVLVAEVSVLVDAVGDFAFELADVFCDVLV
jgi:hypothetical protein